MTQQTRPQCEDLPTSQFDSPLKGCHCGACKFLREYGRTDVELPRNARVQGFVPKRAAKEVPNS